MKIKQIPDKVAFGFIQEHHYSKNLPRLTKYCLGVIENEELVGVVTLGWGTQPLGTIRKLFPSSELTTGDYLEIGKMAFLPEKNGGNFGSKCMSMVIKWIKENLEISYLYTLADGIEGKCGFVYQASNFQYLGSFKTSVYMEKTTHEKIHPRSAKTLLDENARELGREKLCWLTHDFCESKNIAKISGLMFRYIYPLNKKARKALLREHEPQLPPKEDSLEFSERTGNGKSQKIEMPELNKHERSNNHQKHTHTQQALFL